MYKIDTDHGIEVFLVTGLEYIEWNDKRTMLNGAPPPTTAFFSLIQRLNFIDCGQVERILE